MSEDFKNYLDSQLATSNMEAETNNDPVVEEEKAEELPPLPQEIEVDIPADEDEPQEVVSEKVELPQAPKLKTDENGSYQCFVLTPSSHKEKIAKALTEMAKTDDELAKAIAEGKKTFEGCDRYIRNNMQDLMRELKVNGCCGMDDNQIHALARWYMVNADVTDVKNAVKAVSKAKAEKPTKKEQTKKEEKSAQVIDMFADFDFE